MDKKNAITKKTMRVVTISYGRHMFDRHNIEHIRMKNCADEVLELHMVIFTLRKEQYKNLQNKNLFLHPTNSKTRFHMLLDAILIGKKIITDKEWIVTAQDPFEAGLVGYVLKKITGVLFNVQEHGDFFSTSDWKREKITNRFRYVFGKFILKSADCVRVVSKRQAKTMRSIGVSAHRINQLPVAVNLSKFRNAIPDDSFSETYSDNVLILSGGRFVPQKNIPLLLEAFSKVLLQEDQAHLVLIGTGPEEDHIRTCIHRLSLEKNVTVLEWVDSDRLPALIKAADIFAVSSNYEGWCRMIVEAMATGTPVVTTDVGCAGEVCLHEVHGRISPVGDSDTFAQNLLELVADESLRIRCGTAAGLATTQINIDTTASIYARRWVDALTCKHDRELEKKRILIITQSVDKEDSVLGFFHQWLEVFAREYEYVNVIALKKGVFDLPLHVNVHSLGKEEKSRSTFVYTIRLLWLSWRLRKEYDVVFVHMNPEYVIAGFPVWALCKKKIGLWYAHGATRPLLRLATHMSRFVFTSTELGFRIPTNKRRIVGQGIEVQHFSFAPKNKEKEELQLITVGRIAPVKHIETLISCCEKLNTKGVSTQLSVVGDPQLPNDRAYKTLLASDIEKRSLSERVLFKGSVLYDKLPQILHQNHIFVHDGATGSLDKVLLEAMATGLPVFSSNEAFAGIIGETKDIYVFSPQDADMLADKIYSWLHMPLPEREKLTAHNRTLVENQHSLSAFIKKIKTVYA